MTNASTEGGAAARAMIAAAVTRERAKAGLSLSALAARAGVGKSTLSQLEAGMANPSVETLWAVANALEVPLSYLFETSAPEITVIRADEGVTFASEQSDFVASLLADCPPTARREIYRVALEPGAVRRAEPHPVGVVEHAVLLTGAARLGPVETPITLAPGDYARYPGDAPHLYEALVAGTLLLLVMESRG